MATDLVFNDDTGYIGDEFKYCPPECGNCDDAAVVCENIRNNLGACGDDVNCDSLDNMISSALDDFLGYIGCEELGYVPFNEQSICGDELVPTFKGLIVRLKSILEFMSCWLCVLQDQIMELADKFDKLCDWVWGTCNVNLANGAKTVDNGRKNIPGDLAVEELGEVEITVDCPSTIHWNLKGYVDLSPVLNDGQTFHVNVFASLGLGATGVIGDADIFHGSHAVNGPSGWSDDASDGFSFNVPAGTTTVYLSSRADLSPAYDTVVHNAFVRARFRWFATAQAEPTEC